MADHSPRPRARIQGGFEILDEVSRGGHGVVYRARDRTTRRIVALKVHHRASRAREGERAPERELEAARRLDHPGIVKVLGTETTHEGTAIAMQWVEGMPIDRWADQQGPGRGALRRKLEVFVRVCDAVRHAHQRGVLHRDLKPSNILVDDEGRAYVVDFGIARILDEDGQRDAAETIGLVGTPAFLAPEVLFQETRSPDVRSDVYALGSVLFVVLTGRLPYGDARDVPGMIHALASSEPMPVSSTGKGIGRELDHVVAKALAREPSARYQSADALADDVRRYLSGQPVHAHPPSRWYRLRKTVLRHPVASSFAGATGALALVFGMTSVVHATRLTTATRQMNAAAQEASQRAGDLRASVDEFRFLLNSERLVRAIEAAASFYPADPEKIPAMEAWLAESGEPLAAALPRAVTARDALRDRALPWTEADQRVDRLGHPRSDELERYGRFCDEIRSDLGSLRPGDADEALFRTQLARFEEWTELVRADVGLRRTYRFESQRDAYRNYALTRLIAELELFTADNGILARVRDQLQWTRDVDHLSLRQPAARWEHATAAIARHPAYDGLRLSPQRGLVPLGADPNTDLWEFLHLRSGTADASTAERDRDGIVMAPEIGIVFVLLPGGEFWMGAQKQEPGEANYDPEADRLMEPVHRVRLAPFFFSKFETTQAQWRRLSFGDEPSTCGAGGIVTALEGGHDELVLVTHPVESVTWTESADVLATHGLALPTEAQWEYACRAGTTTPWSSGAAPASLEGYANGADRRFALVNPYRRFVRDMDDGRMVHAPVGSYAPNAFGIHDMHGNVHEWCRDSFVSYPEGIRPGDGLRGSVGTHEQHRAIRGGGYSSLPRDMRSSTRSFKRPALRVLAVGVRAVRPFDS